MSKSKIVAVMVLIVFAMGIYSVGNAVAGEKFKCRTVTFTTKYTQIDVGDEDGHLVAVWEGKGIQNNMEGKWFNDGWVDVIRGVSDLNIKTGVGSMVYYGYVTDKDGDKYYYKGELKNMKLSQWEIYKGTGKFEGIRGGGTSTQFYFPAEMLFYANAEWDVEVPRR
jgi:hypothetical protein